MSETTPEQPPTEQPPTEQPEQLVSDAPKDAPDDIASGYAVYDRTLARYVGPVTTDKPSAKDARAAVAKGHSYAVVRV